MEGILCSARSQRSNKPLKVRYGGMWCALLRLSMGRMVSGASDRMGFLDSNSAGRECGGVEFLRFFRLFR